MLTFYPCPGARSGSEYLTGDSFTAADLLLCGGVNFAVNFAKAIPETPAIKGFLERCMSRPAFARVVAKDRAP